MQEELIQLLKNSKKTYDDYMHNGKTFLYAKHLRFLNEQILILIKKMHVEKNGKLEKALFALKEHIEEWIIIWDKEQLIQKPENNDAFIFTVYKKYPKDLELLLIIGSK